MPIDPAIPLAAVARPPTESFNPLISLQQVAQIAALRQVAAAREQEAAGAAEDRTARREEQDVRRQTREREEAARQAVIAAMRQFPGDDVKIAARITELGHPVQGQAWLDMATKTQQHRDALDASGRAREQAGVDAVADVANTVQSPEQFTAGVAQLATGAYPLLTGQQALDIQAEADRDGWQATAQKYLVRSTAAKKARDTVQTFKTTPHTAKEGELTTLPGTGEVLARGPAKPAPTVTGGQLDAQYEALLHKKWTDPAGLTPDEAATVRAYEARKAVTRTPLDPNVAALREVALATAQQQQAQGGLTANQRAQEINSLRNSWVKQIQPVLDRRAAVAKIDTGVKALAAGNRNAATQIIVTAFNKLQDETSVVREGEYARSEQGQATLARIQGALERITQGGSSLTDADLKGLADEAKNVATALEAVTSAALGDTRAAIESTLDDYKIPHDRVFGSSTIGRKAAPAGGGGGGLKAGDVVKHKTQGNVRVTKVNPDGTYEGEVVP